MRAKLVFESGRCRSLRHDSRRKSGRIHHRDRRRPGQIDLHLGQSREVGIEASRIARKVLVRRKLRGVDEDRDDDAPRASPCRPHQRDMAGMQGAHGRDQRNPLPALAPLLDRAAQCGNSAHDAQSVGHEDGLCLVKALRRANYQSGGRNPRDHDRNPRVQLMIKAAAGQWRLDSGPVGNRNGPR